MTNAALMAYLSALEDLDAAHTAVEEAEIAGTLTVRLKDALLFAEARMRASADVDLAQCSFAEVPNDPTKT